MEMRGKQALITSARLVFPGLVAYSASKAALTHFPAGLRADLRGLPIGTTLVELGRVPTGMLAEAADCEPAAKSFLRMINVVRKGRKHVRLPNRGAAFPMPAEVPRRATEIMLTGIPNR